MFIYLNILMVILVFLDRIYLKIQEVTFPLPMPQQSTRSEFHRRFEPWNRVNEKLKGIRKTRQQIEVERCNAVMICDNENCLLDETIIYSDVDSYNIIIEKQEITTNGDYTAR